MLLRECRVISRAIVVCPGVVTSARAAHDLAVLLRRNGRRTAKHQMLEEVREPGLSRFDFVARSDLHRNADADEIRKACRNDDDLKASGQRGLGRIEWQDVYGRRQR